jgi:hypothetical protein
MTADSGPRARGVWKCSGNAPEDVGVGPEELFTS